MTPLRVIHIEDSPDDATLLEIQLLRGGFDATIERVQSAQALALALERGPWDVVIADQSLPGFDAPRALGLLKEKGLDLPFILLSGTIGEMMAVELMRNGAHDFVSKSDPARLEPAIRRELREAENRRARRQAEAEREKTLLQLETVNRAKDEFLAMLGHELRNPLAPIVTALDVMKMRDGGRPSREREIIERQVQHMGRLVDDLLDVAKIARGKVELKRRYVELEVVAGKAIEIASPLFEERRHHFHVDVPVQGLPVLVDEARLAQVISNLLTNAARYTPPGGRIALIGQRDGEEVILRVKDSGAGIDAETLPRIFDLFVQGPRTLDRSVGGLGLGLALVHNLVTLHGGTVSAISEGPGRGSEFVVRLPLAAARPLTAPAPPAPVRAERPTAPKTVLVVDDNCDALEMLAEALRMEGCQVEIADDGPSALAVLERFRPGAIVLDIGLPVMDGYQLATEIRSRPEHRAARLIALTGYGQHSDHDRSRAAGFDVHLVKPVDFSKLLLALEMPVPDGD